MQACGFTGWGAEEEVPQRSESRRQAPRPTCTWNIYLIIYFFGIKGVEIKAKLLSLV